MEIVAIPAITVICMLLAQTYKAVTSESKYKYIPPLCGALGLVLGLVSFYLTPGFIPAENPFLAAAIGIVSGLAATGAHQTKKQVTK